MPSVGQTEVAMSSVGLAIVAGVICAAWSIIVLRIHVVWGLASRHSFLAVLSGMLAVSVGVPAPLFAVRAVLSWVWIGETRSFATASLTTWLILVWSFIGLNAEEIGAAIAFKRRVTCSELSAFRFTRRRLSLMLSALVFVGLMAGGAAAGAAGAVLAFGKSSRPKVVDLLAIASGASVGACLSWPIARKLLTLGRAESSKMIADLKSALPNSTFDRTAGSHSLAAAGQRER